MGVNQKGSRLPRTEIPMHAKCMFKGPEVGWYRWSKGWGGQFRQRSKWPWHRKQGPVRLERLAEATCLADHVKRFLSTFPVQKEPNKGFDKGSAMDDMHCLKTILVAE